MINMVESTWLYKTALPESGATTRWGIPCLLAEGSCSSSPMKREAHAVPVGSVMGVCHPQIHVFHKAAPPVHHDHIPFGKLAN